jgi:hypothetical protein
MWLVRARGWRRRLLPKTGNAYLRSALYRMAVVGSQHNPIIKEHYATSGTRVRLP